MYKALIVAIAHKFPLTPHLSIFFFIFNIFNFYIFLDIFAQALLCYCLFLFIFSLIFNLLQQELIYKFKLMHNHACLHIIKLNLLVLICQQQELVGTKIKTYYFLNLMTETWYFDILKVSLLLLYFKEIQVLLSYQILFIQESQSFGALSIYLNF